MAKHRDEPFTENKSLRVPDPMLPQDDAIPEAGDGLGRAAASYKGDGAGREAPASSAPSSAAHESSPQHFPGAEEGETEETPAAGESTPQAEEGGTAEDAPPPADGRVEAFDDSDAEIRQERVRIAQDAWDEEAQRVDESQPDRARQAWAEEDAQSGRPRKADPEKKPKDRRRRKDKGKKKEKDKDKNKDKKSKSAQDDNRAFLKSMMIIVICGVMFLMVALMVVSNFVDHPLLTMPRKVVTSLVAPVQRVFSGITNSIVDYLRMLKIRGNIEYEYEQLTLMLDDYATMEAQNEEYRRTIQELYALLDEQDEHRDFNPVTATVIATDSGNYFSTLSLDVGTSSGVGEYMAVVAQGGLVGVTYDVTATTCKVRCIINSDCTVAALIQSTRDQGSVKGTLGTTGEAMCRMYYLPDNAVFRPGDMVITSGVGLEFPKGIPIGEVRESTRGMEDNKSYVVIDPIVDFQHLEYVTVYRYRPAYAEAAQSRSSGYSATLEPLFTARPAPTFSVGSASDFLFSQEPSAAPTPEGQTISPSAAPSATPRVTATPDPNATQPPENLTYERTSTPAFSPAPTPTPTVSAAPTQDPGGMTVEDDT